MRFVLPSMIRLMVATGILLTAIAVTLGRHQVHLPDQRTMAAPRYYPISDHLFHEPEPGVRVLDSRTGVGGFSTPWTANAQRTLAVAGTGGVPVGATAVMRS